MRAVWSNLVALTALLFSGWSFYETVWKADNLRLFVAPQIEYADPSNGVFDVYGVPVTIANTGARGGVALSLQLEVENLRSGEKKRYYSAEFGSWRDGFANAAEPFAPISVPGRDAVTRRVLFYPRAGESVDRLVDTEPGRYRFTVTMIAVSIERLPVPSAEDRRLSVSFEMALDGVDYRAFNQGGTVKLYRPDYETVVSE